MLHNLYPIVLSIFILAIAPTPSAGADELQELMATCAAAKDADTCRDIHLSHYIREFSERFDKLIVASASSGTAAIVASFVFIFLFSDPAAAMISGLAGVSSLYFGYQVDKLEKQINWNVTSGRHHDAH